MKMISGLLLIMDENKDLQGDVFSEQCKVKGHDSYDIPIILDSVHSKLHNIIGRCSVSQYGNVLVYDGELFPEGDKTKLEGPICELFFPCVAGKITGKVDGKITEFTVTDVIIATQNADPRIPHIQVKGAEK